VVQQHAFETSTDIDWVYFEAVEGHEYLIEAQVPTDSSADVSMYVYDGCNTTPETGKDPSFSPTIRTFFTVPQSGRIYLELRNEASGFTTAQAYWLSVRDLSAQASARSAVIIVAGKYKENDPLQENIYNVTDALLNMFLDWGYTGDDIYYIAPDNRPGVDAPATVANLRAAITQWAKSRVGPNRALTLFMMDHGKRDVLYLDRPRGQIVRPQDLDAWLSELETARAGAPINVIYEACHSGSFIQKPNSISAPGRVIVTSTSANRLAFASADGATFSDSLIFQLSRGGSLFNSFQEAGWNASSSSLFRQQPWLDDDGDGVPNEPEDGLQAARRGLAVAGSFGAEDEKWAPYIAQTTGPSGIDNGSGVIRTEVRDDKGVKRVWAVVHPPSYQSPTESEELVKEVLPTIVLQDQGKDQFAATYSGFDELGTYRVVVYARTTMVSRRVRQPSKSAQAHRYSCPL